MDLRLVRELLYPRGLTNVVSVRHHGLEIRVVDCYAELERHDYGNLLFLGDELHERCRAAFGLVDMEAGAVEATMEILSAQAGAAVRERST